MNGRLLVRNVAFTEDGISVDYMVLPEDVRENGLARTHNLWIPREEDYDDEIDAVEEAVKEAVLDALDDYGKLPELDLRKQVEDAVAAREAAADDDDDSTEG